MYTYILILACVLPISFVSGYSDCKVESSSKQINRKLKEELLCDYDSSVRPVVDHRNATKVTVKMVLKSFTYDMHSHSISAHCWMVLTWRDEHLKWKPGDHDNIIDLHLHTDELWVPDLSMYNGLDQSNSQSAVSSVTCSLSHTGVIACVPPVKHEALCLANLKKYPYDVQNCTLRFGSWAYSGEEVDFRFSKEPVSIEDYIPNSEWQLINISTSKHKGEYDCCPNSTYPSIAYTFVIKRHAGFYGATIVIPALVMIIVTLLTFCLNAGEMDRLCLSYCNLLSHILYLQYISWQVPTIGDDPPLLILFGRDSLLLCVFTVVFTVLLKRLLSSQNDSPMWISSTISGILGSRPGQIILLFDYSLKGMATAKGEDDGANIIENSETNKSRDCILFAKIFDRLCFIAYFITYFCMFVAFIL